MNPLFDELVINNTDTPYKQISQFLSKSNNSFNLLINDRMQNIDSSFVYFCTNSGQLQNDIVQFYSQNNDIWFTDDGVWFEVREDLSLNSEQSPANTLRSRFINNTWQSTIGDYKRVILKQEFVGANEVQPVGRERLGWNSNFFYGNDPNKWYTNVPNFDEVLYENIYDGIDLRYYANEKGFKYDFLVHPGTDPEQIKVKYIGAKEINIDTYGNLIIKTELENLIDGELIIFQNNDGENRYIEGEFKLINELVYSFELLDDYNPNELLIIDPVVTLNYSTFIGGWHYDWGYGDIAIDSGNNVFLSGTASSPDFPTTPGVFNETNQGADLFVVKLNHNGSKLIFSTFIGGNQTELYSELVIDDFNNSYIVGETFSRDFPTTPGAFNRILNNNISYINGSDIFICKLNSNGSKLNYSTFLGGYLEELSPQIAVDSLGHVVVTGTTLSSDFPTTSGAYNNQNSGGLNDMFVSKLNHNCSDLLYSTFIGGNKSEFPKDIELDSLGNAYITGGTDSPDFPTTQGALYSVLNGNFEDVFILKLDSYGVNLLYSTFIGSSLGDAGFDIEIDQYNNIYVAGSTGSPDFPNTTGAFDTTHNGGTDTFILKLDSNGSTLDFSTYLGGYHHDYVRNIEINSIGNIFATGHTFSSNFPTTKNAFKNSTLKEDIFIVKFNSNCSKMLYSTLFGGTNLEYQTGGMNIDSFGNLVITGYTASLDFPTTPGAFDTSYNGYTDVFVSKFSFRNEINITSLSLLLNSTSTNRIYSKYKPYTFRVNVTDTKYFFNLGYIRLNLDPIGTNCQLLWNRSTGIFLELYDPYDYLILEPTSRAYFIDEQWTVDFNITFNWTYPNEDFNNVKIFASSNTLSSDWYNVTNFYQVENDLVFKSILAVEDKNKQIIYKKSLVKGGEQLTWSGLIQIYENTTNIYPPADEFDVTIWDEDGNKWLDSPKSGQPMNITTTTPNKTTNSFNYTINLTGIPPECDKTNHKFTIRIDADNVTFSNHWPGEDAWQNSSEVYTGITIKDHGGGVVDNTSIMHSISEDNGNTWKDWNSTEFVGKSESITVHDFVTFNDGEDNLIKWSAKDSLGNGPMESESYRILVDTRPVFFTNPIPLPTKVSSKGIVEVGITISDNTSGVNASNIKYSTSSDAGNYWGSWKSIDGFQNGKIVEVSLNLTFPNGTGNRIRWRAYDIAGNGPTYSDEYILNVNIPTPPIIPEAKLKNPLNNSKITTTSVELSWEVIENYHPNIEFDIKLGTQNPPQNVIEQDYTETKLIVDELENGKTYYWTVIPRIDKLNGTCISGVWSFTIDIPLPRAILKTPENNSIITSILPTLVWSLEYEDTETVTYDVYFGTSKDPPLEYEKLTTTYFAINTALQENITYYWYVVPYAGGLTGVSSEVWSFTVKLKEDNIPKFGIELTLNPNSIEIKPGEVKFVSAIVTNLGELNDNFTVSIGNINNSKLIVENYRQDTLKIEPGKNKEFLIMVSIKDGTEQGFENITITAKSKLAEKYNLHVQDSQMLSINILEKDDHDGKERGQPINIFYFSILFLIIILIIISIIVVILVRKKTSKKTTESDLTQDIQPETSPESITTPEPETTLEPLPITTQQQDDTLEE
jgi:hypothetical protein